MWQRMIKTADRTEWPNKSENTRRFVCSKSRIACLAAAQNVREVLQNVHRVTDFQTTTPLINALVNETL